MTVTFLMFNMTGCVIKLQEFKFRLNVNFTTYALTEGMKMTSADWPYISRCFAKAWFSLAHKYKHKHKHIRTRRMAYLTQFSIPLSFPQLGDIKMADASSTILPLICSHEVWVKVAYDWSMALCLCKCLCRARFH